jgi:hypothetical protein
MTSELPVSLIRPLHVQTMQTGMFVRVVKLLDESLMWYRTSMSATIITCDLDNGWALIQLGSSAFVLLSARQSNEDVPICTAVCVAVETIDGLAAQAESRGLCTGTLRPGPWGHEALWLADPEGSIIICFTAPTQDSPPQLLVTGI